MSEKSLNVLQKLQKTVTFLKEQISSQSKLGNPQIGLILGSGLGPVADLAANPLTIPYSEIPYFHSTAVEGHKGQAVIGTINGVSVIILQGRFHYYEGHTMEEVSFPTRVLCSLGIKTLILTNAAGAVNTRYRPGDLMLIDDHLNLMGDNPLRGPHLAQLGPRFPDLSEPYTRKHLETLKKAAETLEIPIHEGVYAGLLGPCYETRAEVRMLRTLGADAVGMSTVPETIAAAHMGVAVAGISCITNLAVGLSPEPLSHQEVIETSRLSAEKMKQLLEASIPKLI